MDEKTNVMRILDQKKVKYTEYTYLNTDVVLYEEGLDNDTVNGALEAISDADCLIIAGTSLTVYPAASFVRYFRGKYLVLINRDETPMDKNADLVIHDKVGEVLSKIKV